MIKHYELKQSFYVLDALECDVERVPEAMLREAQAADIVLLSKIDRLPSEVARDLQALLRDRGLTNVVPMHFGKFDMTKLRLPSRALERAMLYGEDAQRADTSTYSVIDVAAADITPNLLEDVWRKLQCAYGLRRLKGDIHNKLPATVSNTRRNLSLLAKHHQLRRKYVVRHLFGAIANEYDF